MTLSKLKWVIAFILVVMLFSLFCWRGIDNDATELLVAWGVKDDVYGDCILQVIDPNRQKLSQIHTGGICHYQVANIQDQTRLVSMQGEPNAIIMYTITPNGDLVTDKILPVNGFKYISVNFQVGNDGTIYFSGILDNAKGIMEDREQIFRMDLTGNIEPLVVNEAGLAVFPLISPTGSHLIYASNDELKAWWDCKSHCGYYYHVLDIETNSDVDLASLVNQIETVPPFSHCYAKWSPDGRLIAFNVGCESESPQYIVVFNIEDSEIIAVIEPIESDSAIVIDWLSNEELIYRQRAYIEGHEYGFYNYYVYSTVNNKSTEFLNLASLTGSDGTVYRSLDIDWTSDKKDIVVLGVISSGAVPLIVINTDPEEQNITYILTDTYNEQPLLWSPSGNWIAYSSSQDHDDFMENGLGVKITDRTGQIVVDTDIINIKRSLGYAWMRQ